MNIIDRFKNQRISQKIHFKKRDKGSKPARVENCFRLKVKRASNVVLRKKETAEKAHYSGLQTCGSVWSCPVCASIISERRKQFLQNAINVWREKDSCNTVVMITITTPHYIFQSLKDVLDLQDKAIRIMKKQPQRGRYKVWRTIMDELCSIGSYTGREITYGQNGWHPHRHECHFAVRASIEQLKKYRDDIVMAFSIAFQKAGGTISDMKAFYRRSVQIDQITDDDGFDRISSYITKVEGKSWTLAQEATKGIVKTAKNGNITPFGMLDAIRFKDEKSSLYESKFYEYAKTMHGKKQFFPTHGLNAFFGLNWLTDAELIQENDAISEYFADIRQGEWSQILHYGLRGEVLDLTRGLNEFEFIAELSALLRQYYKKAG